MEEEQKCRTCKFGYRSGELCRRYPPVLIEKLYGENRFDWVATWPDAWCGEFVQKPLDDSPGV